MNAGATRHKESFYGAFYTAGSAEGTELAYMVLGFGFPSFQAPIDCNSAIGLQSDGTPKPVAG